MNLTGVRIVEWADFVSGPYCTHLLQELGAQVDKIEDKEGDSSRRYGPFPDQVPNSEASGLFMYLNSGKRSASLDLDGQDLEVFHRLLAQADVFVCNMPLCRRKRLKLDPDAIRTRHPRLIVVSLSVFGDRGAHADVPGESIDSYAVSGLAYVIGEPDKSPLIIPHFQAEFQAGAYAAAAALVSLISRDRPGATSRQGEWVDISSAEVLAAGAGTNSMIYLFNGRERWERAGRRAYGSGGPYPYVTLPCKDGYVCLLGRARKEWDKLVEAMGSPDWSREPRYQDLLAMGRDYPEEVDALIIPWLAQYTKQELMEMAHREGFPLAPLRTLDDVVKTDQFEYRGYFRDVKNSAGTSIRVPGLPWKFIGQAGVASRPSPSLGQHTLEILKEAHEEQ